MANSIVPARATAVHLACEPHAGPILSREDAKARGLKRYFTGNPCPHGHIVERRVSTMKCIQCCRDEFAAWAKSNPERVRERAKISAQRNPEAVKRIKARWWEKHRDRVLAEKKEYRDTHKEEVSARKRDYYLGNKGKVLEKSAEWQRANPDKVRVRNKKWRDANPDASRSILRRRRGRLAGAEGFHNGADIIALFDRQGGRCGGCGSDISVGYHVDHIHPLSRGGSNWPQNLQLLCQWCNSSKGALTMVEWLAKKPFEGRRYAVHSGLPDYRSGHNSA